MKLENPSRHWLRLLAVISLVWATCGHWATGEVIPVNPRCEYLVNPRGIDEVRPRLSWELESRERGQFQTAYRILVASSAELLANDEGDLWDSGKVSGDATHQIAYQGVPLDSRLQCFWKVCTWDRHDVLSGWSEPALWTIGLLAEKDWSAKWIDGRVTQISRDLNQVPVIEGGVYESEAGEGFVDVTSMLQEKAKSGSFRLPIRNLTFGGDPATNQLKRLKVEYEIGGVKTVRYFAEDSEFVFPNDLKVPPHITRAVYGAADGDGEMDVTSTLLGLAARGGFTAPVNNSFFGKDPALERVKRLNVEFEVGGQKHSRSIAEGKGFHYPSDLRVPEPVPYLRKEFSVGKPVKRATLYATALGIYELYLNGKRVGDHYLAPDWTDYRVRSRYQEYDVTSSLTDGRNALGAQIAGGWYSGTIGNGGFEKWGKSPALKVQLEIVYMDGSSERVVTDQSWKGHASPLISTDFMAGEIYDASKEIPGWDRANFNDRAWANVTVRDEPSRKLNGQVSEPVRVMEMLPAVKMTEPRPGRWTYDLGQNMVGIVRLKIDAPAGTRIVIRHGEMLDGNGRLYTDNLRAATATDTYICAGGGVEVWQPRFTVHGFRYVELSGIAKKPPLDAVTGLVIGSDTPMSGTFSCSDGLVNQLQSNIRWSQKGNYLSVPTDCPQRDERLGWLGDAQVFVRTATFNADVAAFYSKWLVDVRDSQTPTGMFGDAAPSAGPSSGTPGWGDAGVICPWTIYEVYGDQRLLERQYPSMVKWVEYCRTESSHFLRKGYRGADYGDWLAGEVETDKELIATAYFARSTALVAKAANVLGKTEDVARFNALFGEIKKMFIANYVSVDGRISGDSQCAYAMALMFDLLPAHLRGKAVDHLEQDIIRRGYHLSSGFMGTGLILPALTDAGRLDTAYRLLHQENAPSWLHPVKHGATTIWERWDGWTPERGFQDVNMNSFNHYALGACGEWLYETVAGIAPDPGTNGFKRMVIRPQPGGKISAASAVFRSIHGRISSEWKQEENRFVLTTRIPANTLATLYLPVGDQELILESGKPIDEAVGVRLLRREAKCAVFELQSGHYQFSTGKDVDALRVLIAHRQDELRIPVSALLGTEAEGAGFYSVGPESIRGGRLQMTRDTVYYQSPPGRHPDDRFTFKVRDSSGGITLRVVEIVREPDKISEQEGP